MEGADRPRAARPAVRPGGRRADPRQQPRGRTRAAYAGLGLFVGWSFIGTGAVRVVAAAGEPVRRAADRRRLRVDHVRPVRRQSADLLHGRPAVRERLDRPARPRAAGLSVRTARDPAASTGSWPRRGRRGCCCRSRWSLFLGTPDEDFCDDCPTNPLLLVDNHATVQVVSRHTGRRRRRGARRPDGRARRSAGARRRRLAARRLGTCSGSAWPRPCCSRSSSSLLTLQLDGAVADLVFLLAMVCVVAVPYGFLAGLLRTRFSRAEAVNELVERLGATAAGEGGLRDALAHGARGPRSVARVLASRAEPLRRRGRPAGRAAAARLGPSGLPGRARRAADRRDRPRRGAVRAHGPDPRPRAPRRRCALENERLDAEVRARVEELRESRARIVQAADEERRRLERDLHDGAQQRLVALALTLARGALQDRRRSRAGRGAARRGRRGARTRDRGAARAGPRHPPRGADRPRARPGARRAGRARAAAGRAEAAAGRAASRRRSSRRPTSSCRRRSRT